jgi:hypothetical protein
MPQTMIAAAACVFVFVFVFVVSRGTAYPPPDATWWTFLKIPQPNEMADVVPLRVEFVVAEDEG